MTICTSKPAWQACVIPCVLLLLAAGLVACGQAPAASPPVSPVATVLVQLADGGEAAAFPVELQARYNSDLGFRVPGKVIERRAHVGDRVRKGQLLARLDPGDAQQQQQAAKAGLLAAEHRLVFARQQLQRDRAQMQQELISKAQLEQTEDNLAAAEAARQQAQAQLGLQQNNLQYTQLLAEHDGLITAESAETGAVVAAGQPIYSLAWSPEMDAVLDVSASDLPRWPRGQLGSLQLSELPGLTLPARVREVAAHEDSQSGSYRIKLSLLQADARVHPGMTASVSPARGQTAAQQVLVPSSALFHQGNRPAVWVVRPDNQRLELRAVTVGEYRSSQVLIRAGLRAGERIVQAGVHNVHQGQQVQPLAPPAAALDAADGAGLQ